MSWRRPPLSAQMTVQPDGRMRLMGSAAARSRSRTEPDAWAWLRRRMSVSFALFQPRSEEGRARRSETDLIE